MTELLKKAINALEQLPASEQDAMAQQILADLQDEDRWEASFNDPRSEIVLDRLITRAKEEVKQGKISDLNEIP